MVKRRIPIPRNILMSYHYFKDYDLDRVPNLTIIGDSGAFSAKSQGATITTKELADWAKKWRHRLKWVAALDVIGNPVSTYSNWREMVDVHGVEAIPTIHYGTHPSDLDKYARRGVDLVGLGGLVRVPTDPADHLNTTFSAPPNPGLVIVRNVRIQSTCAHHLLPIEGTATIAYRPTQGSRVVGLSKLTRLAEGYARRLQVQENITAQIVGAINDRLKPEWVGCAITATHGCMTIRGVRDECSDTVTFNEAGQPRPVDHQAFWAAHNTHN